MTDSIRKVSVFRCLAETRPGRTRHCSFNVKRTYVLEPAPGVQKHARVGISHLTDFERIAVVTGHDWIEQSVRAFGVLIPCPVRIFDDDELDTARTWIDERPADADTDALHINIERSGAVARIHARLHGSLDHAAEDRLIRTVTDGIGNADEIRVLVEAVDFHGWRDLRALWHHLRFVAGQRTKIERIAMVGDARWQRRLVASARHVFRIDARFFDQEHIAEAKTWLQG